MNVDTVVFDIGAVLVHWRPELAWTDGLGLGLGLDGARAFLARIDFDKINLACDAGASFAKAAGMDTIHFSGPEALRTQLQAKGVL